MSNLKTLTTFAIATFLATSAFAQDAEPETIFDTPSDTLVSDFTSADLDQNGSLNADEFVTYAVMRAEDGEEAFKDIVMGGEYNVAFVSHDTDASGSLEPTELPPQSDMEPAPESVIPEEDQIIISDGEEITTPDN